MTREQANGITRHLLNSALAYAAANGAMSTDGALVVGGSAAGVLAVMAWSFISKRGQS